jgi:hypothetical protein
MFLKTTRQAMYVYRNIDARSWNSCCRAEEISITYSEGVFVALSFQQAMRMRHVGLRNIFPRYPINYTIFKKKNYETKSVFDFTAFESSLILRIIQQDMINVYWS